MFTAGVELRQRARKSRLFHGPRPLFRGLRVTHVKNVVCSKLPIARGRRRRRLSAPSGVQAPVRPVAFLGFKNHRFSAAARIAPRDCPESLGALSFGPLFSEKMRFSMPGNAR